MEILLTSRYEHFYNQFAFGPATISGNNRRIAADIIELDNDNYTIKSVIELKTNKQGSSGDFYWACYEVVYYYFLLRQAYDENTDQEPAAIFRRRYRLKEPMKLQVYAPSSFYDKNAEQFLKTINSILLHKVNASISFVPVNNKYLKKTALEKIKKRSRSTRNGKRK